MTRAFHFLQADLTAGSGTEGPWTVGETRTLEGEIKLCERGYHAAPSWFDALSYAPGSVACIVDIAEPIKQDATKFVTRTRTLVAARDVSRELRLFACDCAERALNREEEHGRKVDPRSREAIAVSRRFADGQATPEELAAAREAAWDAAWDAARKAAREAAWDAARKAAWDAAWAAAREAAWDAAWDAARKAAREAETTWQRVRLAEYLDPLFAEVAV